MNATCWTVLVLGARPTRLWASDAPSAIAAALNLAPLPVDRRRLTVEVLPTGTRIARTDEGVAVVVVRPSTYEELGLAA